MSAKNTPTKSPSRKSEASTPSPNKSPAKSNPGSESKEKEGSAIKRQYSEESDRTLKHLDELDNYFASFAARVEKIDKSINMGDRSTLVAAKHELAQIIGDLENLQFGEVLCIDVKY
jgi:molecular chaperone GrpE (heat shock protein)